MCGCVSTRGVREHFEQPVWRLRGPGQYRFEAPDGAALAELARTAGEWLWQTAKQSGRDRSMVRAMDAAEAALDQTP